MKTDQLYFRFGQSESEKRAAEKIANLYREQQKEEAEKRVQKIEQKINEINSRINAYFSNHQQSHQDPSSKCLTEELSPSASFRQLCPVLVSLQEIWQDCHN